MMNNLRINTPSIIRFGELTEDELFVSEDAARAGVRIRNLSECDNIVMLKHFGPGKSDLPVI